MVGPIVMDVVVSSDGRELDVFDFMLWLLRRWDVEEDDLNRGRCGCCC